MDQIKLGKLIAELRKKQRLTQAQLGEKLNISDKTVSKWENGNRTPDISILNDLSEILEITTTELLNGKLNIEDNLQKTALIIDREIKDYIKLCEALLLFLGNIYTSFSIYIVESKSHIYNISGLLITSLKQNIIQINYIEYGIDIEFIYSYEYSLYLQNKEIYKIGNLLLYEHKEDNKLESLATVLMEIKIYIVNTNHNLMSANFLDNENFFHIKYINEDLVLKDIKIPLVFYKIFSDDKINLR